MFFWSIIWKALNSWVQLVFTFNLFFFCPPQTFRVVYQRLENLLNPFIDVIAAGTAGATRTDWTTGGDGADSELITQPEQQLPLSFTFALNIHLFFFFQQGLPGKTGERGPHGELGEKVEAAS